MKIDAKKYIDTMKKELPKIQKKLLEYQGKINETYTTKTYRNNKGRISEYSQ